MIFQVDPMEQRSGCILCGKELVYPDRAERKRCSYCGREYLASAFCREGHYVCDGCHSRAALEMIEEHCRVTGDRDPVAIAGRLMKHPAVKMHGPEHHFLVPAVLIAAYCNTTGRCRDRDEMLRKARERAEMVKGGFCGFLGDCGAAVGTGIFISVITGSTPVAREEWRLSNTMTARSLYKIARAGGPRCCKRNTLLALLAAATFLKYEMGVEVPVEKPPRCEFSGMNRECLGAECPFHG